MILVLLLLSSCLCGTAADNGYDYEAQEGPIAYASQVPLVKGVPTGGYSFLGVERKKTSGSPDQQTDLDKGKYPVMYTVPDSSSGTRYILDLVLVLDSSYTVTAPGWIQIKEAANKLIDGLDISPNGTHVSIMKFSTDVEAFYKFYPNAGKDTLKAQINDLEYDGKWSRLDTALQAVDDHVFSPIGGAGLGNVPKAVVIFSDGKADGPSAPDEEIDWQQRLAEPINSLRQKNVELFGVAAGVADKVALQAITGNPARIFDMEKMDELAEALKAISQQVPLAPPAIPPLQGSGIVTVTVTVTEKAGQNVTSSSSVKIQVTHTINQTVTATKSVTSTPVATVTATEITTALLTATETASTLIVTATKTNILTETVTATATESLTSTAMNTATATLTTITTATEVVTLTTTLGVTATTYALAEQTPIPITIMGTAAGRKKRNALLRAKRWYENYIPTFIKTWMAIDE